MGQGSSRQIVTAPGGLVPPQYLYPLNRVKHRRNGAPDYQHYLQSKENNKANNGQSDAPVENNRQQRKNNKSEKGGQGGDRHDENLKKKK